MKLSHASGATQDGRVMVERSDRMWSTGEGNGLSFKMRMDICLDITQIYQTQLYHLVDTNF